MGMVFDEASDVQAPDAPDLARISVVVTDAQVQVFIRDDDAPNESVLWVASLEQGERFARAILDAVQARRLGLDLGMKK